MNISVVAVCRRKETKSDLDAEKTIFPMDANWMMC